ncbi:thiol-disulfide oxidoreductase DCC family protein [Brevibacillus sp. SYP-B805]|uniref:thiol-disulfide oxidoreductase DCC family protein n=1 Tax=Brevibacillus sp. SYP-B805 TaxID=1578199 RepID=UPI0013ECE462|nr:thiol-disulfide oxidoreductase DCC family protein [Brevibacillus sp. SYP-B805]NGQ97121.1 thiol-disulfide oxidoreductase DCC family protein [Brevibacillus sp. SYP-B805]
MNRQPSILLFDGVCNLCHQAVQFIIRRDPHGRIHFASLQSEAGRQLLERYHLPQTYLDSIVLVDDGKIYTQSTAALRIARKLHGWWPALYLLILVPRFIRDPFYRWVARNRYKWFGKREACLLPTPELRKRFLDWR